MPFKVHDVGKIQNNVDYCHFFFGIECISFTRMGTKQDRRVRPPGPSEVDPGAEPHDPGLYKSAGVATGVDGFAAVTDEHLDFYAQEGYLAIENAFSPAATRDAANGLVDLIMGANPEFKGIVFEAKAAAKLDTLSAEERQDAVRKLMHFVDFEPRLAAIANDPRLLNVIQRLLGEPPKMFQDMALIKPPHFGREKPWHQDKAYFDLSLSARVVGVWIALDPATVENGCMHVQPRGHHDGPFLHFKRRDWQICDTEIMGKPCVAVPLKPGGLLLFDGLLPHGTPTNFSPHRRKALQFHYAGISCGQTSTDERLAVFGSEGKDVTC
ncbi:MAG: phytanoyl-CoA dioxygenase family protein [Opitutales bacterium]|nr:phytanoyl-CoA dioxygenase family protein [Opitutales bacterium]